MSRLKNETLSIRISAEIKQLLRLTAERERRSVASMVEILVQPRDYATPVETDLRPHTHRLGRNKRERCPLLFATETTA